MIISKDSKKRKKLVLRTTNMQDRKMERELTELLPQVCPLDGGAMDEARKRQAKLAKPPGSLGTLEELSITMAGITGSVRNKIKNKTLLVFAADNGVVEEGVSSAPQSVTLMQTVNLTRSKTGASVLATHFRCSVLMDYCDGAKGNYPVVYNLQDSVRDMLERRLDIYIEADTYLSRFPEAVIICDEVGCGIVPMDKSERIWREAVGRLCCYLARCAESVDRAAR